MSATLQVRGVAAAFGDRELFSGLDLVVAPGDVVGLVGPNGAGKTTLLRILAGQRAPEQGSVQLSPATAQVGYLVQEVERRAKELGADTIRLDTFSWQGREFYEAIGYRVVGHYENERDGYEEFFFLKHI